MDVLFKDIQNIFEMKGFTNVRVDMENNSISGYGMASSINKIVVCGLYEGVAHKEYVIVKKPIENSVSNKMPFKKQHRRELFFYSKISPVYEALQDEFVSKLQLLSNVRLILPECIGICGSQGDEAIVLKNLYTLGYEMMKPELLDYDHTVMIFRAIGKLHALSFIYKERFPEDFAKVTKKLMIDDLYESDDDYDNKYLFSYADKAFNELLNAIENENIKNKLVKLVDKRVMDKAIEIRSKGKIKALIHGDNWSNNFLYKYKDQTPDKIVPLDFQLVRYGSIAYDIVHIFAFSVYGELRSIYFKDLVNEYYLAFKDFVNQCGFDAAIFFTYDDLWTEIQEQSLLGLLWTAILLPAQPLNNFSIEDALSYAEVPLTDECKEIINSHVNLWSKLGFL